MVLNILIQTYTVHAMYKHYLRRHCRMNLVHKVPFRSDYKFSFKLQAFYSDRNGILNTVFDDFFD